MSTPAEENIENDLGDGHDNEVNNPQPAKDGVKTIDVEALLCEGLRRVHPFADSFFSAQEEIMNLPKGSMWKKDPIIIQAILENIDDIRKCAIRGKEYLTQVAAKAVQEEATKNLLRVMEEQEKVFYNQKN
jgi:hypothetical protein